MLSAITNTIYSGNVFIGFLVSSARFTLWVPSFAPFPLSVSPPNHIKSTIQKLDVRNAQWLPHIYTYSTTHRHRRHCLLDILQQQNEQKPREKERVPTKTSNAHPIRKSSIYGWCCYSNTLGCGNPMCIHECCCRCFLHWLFSVDEMGLRNKSMYDDDGDIRMLCVYVFGYSVPFLAMSSCCFVASLHLA